MHTLDSQSVQLIVVLAVAVTMLLQAFALLAIFTALKKAAASMRQDVEELARLCGSRTRERTRAAGAHRAQN